MPAAGPIVAGPIGYKSIQTDRVEPIDPMRQLEFNVSNIQVRPTDAVSLPTSVVAVMILVRFIKMIGQSGLKLLILLWKMVLMAIRLDRVVKRTGPGRKVNGRERAEANN